MLKLGGGIVGAIVLMVVWRVRQGAMKKRMREFDDGTRCVACHSVNMAVTGAAATCRDCGHRADLEAMRASQLTDDQIRDVTRPQ